MLNELKIEASRTLTENGAATLRTTGSDCLDLFAAIGALRNAAKQEIVTRFSRAYSENPDLAMKMLFYSRDIHGGLGERRVFRTILKYLADAQAESVRKNLHYVSVYGRWDDLIVLFGTGCEKEAMAVIRDQLAKDLAALDAGENVSLMAKWLPSVNTSNAAAVKDAKRIARALGMYFSERCKGEFRNHFITFSRDPQLVEIKGRDLVEKVRYCESFGECANTNIRKVFELILSTAVKNKLPQEDLPETLYFISDMEFDSCADGAALTNFECAKQLFEALGYRLPKVVFWNVQSRNRQQPVHMNEQGVILISGCTPRIFSMVAGGRFDPVLLMKEVLLSERYAPICA